MKREDELPFGSKTRKYLSLLPYLQTYKKAILIGSAQSNHVLAALQILRQNQIEPIPLLLKPYCVKGNFLLSSLLMEQVHWISRKDWKNVTQHARELQKEYPDAAIIPEGAFMKEALPGVCTLAEDITRNEKNLSLSFDHIFIAAGTGLTAFALLLSFSKVKKPVYLHILSMAENLSQKLEQVKQFFGSVDMLIPHRIYRPKKLASFGATSKSLFQFIRQFALKEGVLLDPLYNAKLIMEGREIIEQEGLTGNILFIHSGGMLSLTGWEESVFSSSMDHNRMLVESL